MGLSGPLFEPKLEKYKNPGNGFQEIELFSSSIKTFLIFF